MTNFEKTVLAYRDLFDSVNGRTVLDDLRKSFGDRRSFAKDAYVTAFHEGQRDVYLRILFMRREPHPSAPMEDAQDA